jgi:hypothetical protein
MDLSMYMDISRIENSYEYLWILNIHIWRYDHGIEYAENAIYICMNIYINTYSHIFISIGLALFMCKYMMC